MKKLLSFVLAICLCLSAFCAFAESGSSDTASDAAEAADEKSGSAEIAADDVDLDEAVIEELDLFAMEQTIYYAMKYYEQTDNDFYKAIAPEVEQIGKIAKFAVENKLEDVDIDKLAKEDALKDCADAFANADKDFLKAAVGVAAAMSEADESEKKELYELEVAVVLVRLGILCEIFSDEMTEQDNEGFGKLLKIVRDSGDEQALAICDTAKEYFEKLIKDEGKDEVLKAYKDLLAFIHYIPSEDIVEVVKPVLVGDTDEKDESEEASSSGTSDETDASDEADASDAA